MDDTSTLRRDDRESRAVPVLAATLVAMAISALLLAVPSASQAQEASADASVESATIPSPGQPGVPFLCDLDPAVSSFSSCRGQEINGVRYAVTPAFTPGFFNPSSRTVEYDLQRQYATFQATIGVLDQSSSVTEFDVAIFGDEARLYTGTFRLGQSESVDLDVRDVLRLRLEITRTEAEFGAGSTGIGLGDASLTELCARFSDVASGHPFCREIEWLADSGITTGYNDGTFRPNVAVSRQATAAFFYRQAGEPSFTPPATPSFSDVPVDHPFFAEIEWLATSGITTGYPDGTFRPNSDVNRQAAAAFFYRLEFE